MLAKLDQDGNELLVLDAGDMLFPRLRSPFDSVERRKSRAVFIIETQGRLGLDAWTPSLLDLRLGLDELVERARRAGIRLVASNLEMPDGGPPPVDRHLLIERAGVRIGLIGLVGPRKSAPGDVKFSDPLEAARRELRALASRADPIDLIICLSNLGLASDVQLAQQVDGIHVIIGAGDDRMILVPRRIGDTLILQPYKHGEYLGLLRLQLADAVLPMFDELKRIRLERQLSRVDGSEPDESDKSERSAGIRRQLSDFEGRSSYRAVLRPLAEDIPDDEDVARTVRAQLEAESQ